MLFRSSGSFSSLEADDLGDEDYYKSMRHIHDFLQAMACTCILFHKPPIPKLSQLELVLTSYCIHHPNHFCCNLRLSPKTYDAILSHIEDDPIFYSDPNHNQLPPLYQLAIFLWWMGHFGNAASVASIAQWAGCSEGTVWHCTQWCMIAVMRLHPCAFARPTHCEIAGAKVLPIVVS